jgi:hypothetical protein
MDENANAPDQKEGQGSEKNLTGRVEEKADQERILWNPDFTFDRSPGFSAPGSPVPRSPVRRRPVFGDFHTPLRIPDTPDTGAWLGLGAVTDPGGCGEESFTDH